MNKFETDSFKIAFPAENPEIQQIPDKSKYGTTNMTAYLQVLNGCTYAVT